MSVATELGVGVGVDGAIRVGVAGLVRVGVAVAAGVFKRAIFVPAGRLAKLLAAKTGEEMPEAKAVWAAGELSIA